MAISMRSLAHEHNLRDVGVNRRLVVVQPPAARALRAWGSRYITFGGDTLLRAVGCAIVHHAVASRVYCSIFSVRRYTDEYALQHDAFECSLSTIDRLYGNRVQIRANHTRIARKGPPIAAGPVGCLPSLPGPLTQQVSYVMVAWIGCLGENRRTRARSHYFPNTPRHGKPQPRHTTSRIRNLRTQVRGRSTTSSSTPT